MISFRAFRNSDPPRLAEIWRSQAEQRGMAQPMSGALLEQHVFGKPYFDPSGLIVALDDTCRPVGFVHAGFGPGDDHTELCRDLGVTCILLVEPGPEHADIARQLLQQSEMYLKAHGAKVLYAGGIHPLDPFYLGLYGGSELPGVLDSDVASSQLYRAQGYQEIDRVLVMQRFLTDFRPAVDRQQLQLGRRHSVQQVIEPQARNWWEACTTVNFDRTRFELMAREGGAPLATVTYWNMELLGANWGVRAAGMVDLRVESSHQRQGLATFLLGKSLEKMQADGVGLIELQVMQSNTAAVRLYQKQGFKEVDQGTVLRKTA